MRGSDGQFLPEHGMRNTRLYRIWSSMKCRCYNPNCKTYPRYGAKGITVCEEWQTFEGFMRWALANGYSEDLTIDRVDGTKGYDPTNCRWTTYTEQNRNKSSNHILEYQGRKQCISAWSEETGISKSTILYRANRGKPIEEVLGGQYVWREKNRVHERTGSIRLANSQVSGI